MLYVLTRTIDSNQYIYVFVPREEFIATTIGSIADMYNGG